MSELIGSPQRAAAPRESLAAPPATPLPLSKLHHQLGFGAGVSVFEMVRSPRVNQFRSPWAVKSILKTHVKTTIYGKRLMAEADLLKQMNHPNIVGFRKLTAMTDGRPCLAMEKCGKSLGDMNEERRENGLAAYPKENMLKMMFDISSALDYIHTKAFLLHCDVKSYNVLVNGNFEICKLCDFGVSLPLDKDGKLDQSKGKADYIGTECWAAPEVLLNDSPITNKTDIFSFGLTIWEMMSLVLPHCDYAADESCVTNDSMQSIDGSFIDEPSQTYGTRPPIPDDIDEKEYDDVLSIFLLATEDNPDNRPSAYEIYKYVKKVIGS
ncbi:lymphokine-activated killer T-cell-originated protein kinase [Arctopsyche grandis]|uniref:lymphokine-activated killer T-cell-originated protein kinase n=1 Tax=Arctopsyche grandis TaxID=121162 RepID=UPI00406D80CB